MGNTQKALAELFARVASIPDVEQLREGERLLLVEDCQKLLQTILDTLYPADPDTPKQELLQPLPQGSMSFASQLGSPLPFTVVQLVFTDLCTLVRKIIVDLLEGKEIPQPIPRTLLLNKETRIVHEGWGLSSIETDLHSFLLGMASIYLINIIITQKPFPFGQCPICNKIFARNPNTKMSKYCSKECANKALLAARRVGRRGYMKDYRERHKRKSEGGETLMQGAD